MNEKSKGQLLNDELAYRKASAYEMANEEERAVIFAYAKEYMAINNEAPSFSECLERFDKKLDEMSGNLLNATQEINLKEEMSGNSEIKAFVDDKAYHLREAQTAKEWAEWHHKRANEAIAKGDLSSAKDHTSRAQSYERQAKEHLESASKCTK